MNGRDTIRKKYNHYLSKI